MHRQISTMLLLGAALMAMAASTAAQTASATSKETKFPLEAAFTYNVARSSSVNGAGFWAQGVSAQVHGRLFRMLGAVADVEGTHASNINSTGVGLDMVTATFGPRLTWSPARSKYALFGQALVGEAWGFNSAFPAAGGVQSSQNSLALKIGGGGNVVFSRHLSWRVVEADWLQTHLPNATNNQQNGLRLGSGVVIFIR